MELSNETVDQLAVLARGNLNLVEEAALASLKLHQKRAYRWWEFWKWGITHGVWYSDVKDIVDYIVAKNAEKDKKLKEIE